MHWRTYQGRSDFGRLQFGLKIRQIGQLFQVHGSAFQIKQLDAYFGWRLPFRQRKDVVQELRQATQVHQWQVRSIRNENHLLHSESIHRCHSEIRKILPSKVWWFFPLCWRSAWVLDWVLHFKDWTQRFRKRVWKMDPSSEKTHFRAQNFKLFKLHCSKCWQNRADDLELGNCPRNSSASRRGLRDFQAKGSLWLCEHCIESHQACYLNLFKHQVRVNQQINRRDCCSRILVLQLVLELNGQVHGSRRKISFKPANFGQPTQSWS